MKKKNLTWTVLISVLALVILCVLIIGLSWINDVKNKSIIATNEIFNIQFDNSKTELKSTIISLVDYIEYQRIQTESILRKDIKERTYEAYSIMNNIYKMNIEKYSETEIKKMIIDALRDVRFNDGRGYYFIDTLEGDVILYPTLPSIEGTNQIELKDDLGNYALKNEINLVQLQQEGYIEGYWQKPNINNDKTYKKITYVKVFEPYGWYFGCGEYVDDVETVIKSRILEYFNSLTFGKNNDQYIFVHDESGIELANGKHQELIETNNYELTDLNGTYVIKEQIKLANSENSGGFLTHFWRGNTEFEEIEKLTYVHHIADWQWVIGTGFSVNEINDIIKTKQIELEENFKSQIIRISLILLLALILATIIANILVFFIKKNLNKFIVSIGESANSLKEIKLEKIAYDDFHEMVQVTNRMTTTINNLLHRDELTGLYNRRGLQKMIVEFQDTALIQESIVSLIMFDIDHFKKVNDKYGHILGDEVLKKTAEFIMICVRDFDFVARYGGEEFLIILKNTEHNIALEIAERIRITIETTIIETIQSSITVSGGISTGQAKNINDLIKLADENLYEAKKNGRNQII